MHLHQLHEQIQEQLGLYNSRSKAYFDRGAAEVEEHVRFA